MRMYEYADWIEPDDSEIAVCVEIFSLLADATRMRIVLALREGEQSVGAIAGLVGKSQAAVSQHLAKLRMSRLVTTRHEGPKVYYSLANDHPLELLQVAIRQAEHAVGGSLRHHDRGQ
ncbi:metalloregulator ArsR/SmtB family transcription factor [Nocardioides dubius]